MAQKEKSEPMPIEEIRRRIISRLGIEEDELKTLYPTEQRVRDFYEQEVLTLSQVANAEDDWPEDSYELSQDGKNELAESKARTEENVKRQVEAKKYVKEEREKIKRPAEFKAVSQTHLPVKQRVSIADIAREAKLLKGLNLEGNDHDQGS